MLDNQKIILEEIKPVPRKFITPILLLVSAIFIVAGIFFINTTNNNKQYYRETSAVITLIDSYIEYKEDSEGKTTSKRVYNAYVTYSIDNKTFSNVKLPTYNSSMKEGQTITITYDYRQPEKPILNANSSYILATIIIVVGGLVCLSTIVYHIVIHRKRQKENKRIQQLIATGIMRKVTIDSIIRNSHELRFYCMVDGFEYLSPCLEPNDELYTGCTVNIYFEKEGYETRKTADKWHSNHYIDLSSVEKGQYKDPANY